MGTAVVENLATQPVVRLPGTRFGRLINQMSTLDRITAADRAVVNFLAPKRMLPNFKQRAALSTAQVVMHEVDGLMLRTYVWNNIPGSPYVVLGHGFMMNAASMLGFVKPLLQAGFSVVVWDQPGHGESDGESTFVHTWAEAFATIGQSYAPLAGIIGFSLSGTTALKALAENPSFKCPQIVCINSPRQVNTVMVGYLLKHGCSPDLLPAMHVAAAFRGWYLPAEETCFMAAGRGLPQTRCHFVQDQNDAVASAAEAKYWASTVHNATLEWTSGLQHQGILGRDQHIARIVSYLDSQCEMPRKLRSRM